MKELFFLGLVAMAVAVWILAALFIIVTSPLWWPLAWLVDKRLR